MIDDKVSREALDNSVKALNAAALECGTKPNGIYHMSAKQNSKGIPSITEVNIGRTPSTISIFNRIGRYNASEFFLNYALNEEINDPENVYDIPSEIYYAIRSIDQPLCIKTEKEINRIKKI